MTSWAVLYLFWTIWVFYRLYGYIPIQSDRTSSFVEYKQDKHIYSKMAQIKCYHNVDCLNDFV